MSSYHGAIPQDSNRRSLEGTGLLRLVFARTDVLMELIIEIEDLLAPSANELPLDHKMGIDLVIVVVLIKRVLVFGLVVGSLCWAACS